MPRTNNNNYMDVSGINSTNPNKSISNSKLKPKKQLKWANNTNIGKSLEQVREYHINEIIGKTKEICENEYNTFINDIASKPIKGELLEETNEQILKEINPYMVNNYSAKRNLYTEDDSMDQLVKSKSTIIFIICHTDDGIIPLNRKILSDNDIKDLTFFFINHKVGKIEIIYDVPNFNNRYVHVFNTYTLNSNTYVPLLKNVFIKLCMNENEIQNIKNEKNREFQINNNTEKLSMIKALILYSKNKHLIFDYNLIEFINL
jgi:hypothetical protein